MGINPVPLVPPATQSRSLHIRRLTANGVVVSSNIVPDALGGRVHGAGVSAAGDIVIVGGDNPAQVQIRKFDAVGTPAGSFQLSSPAFRINCEGTNVLFEGNKILVPCQFTDFNINFPVGQNHAALVRFNSNLTLDNTFGTVSSGIALGLGTVFDGTLRSHVVASDGSGGYFMLASVVDKTGGSEEAENDIDDAVFVQHFNAEGQLDTSYGNNGVALVLIETAPSQLLDAQSLFLDSQNRLLVGGFRLTEASPPFGFTPTGFVARLSSEGDLDPSFGVGGLVDPFNDLEQGYGVPAIFGDSSGRLHILTNGVVRRVFDNGALEGDPRDAPGPFVFRPSRIAAICCPTAPNMFEPFATWQNAVVVDGGNAALLLGGADQFAVGLFGFPTTAVATMAKIDLGQPPVAPVASFTTTGVAVGEAFGTVNVGVQLSAAAATDTTLSFGFSGGARLTLDYTVPNGATVVIPAGQTTGSLAVQIVNDALDEKVRTLTIVLNEATANNRFALVINDNDPEPSVSFDRADGFVSEGARFSVRVRLSAPSGKLVSVPFTLAGTADAADDYTLTPTTGTVFFNPGQTEKFILIQTTAGDADNRKETIVITLQDPATATLGTFPQRTVFINP
ncbi:MAG: Calx-beta domain-containing protein [Panacagrimonas sp.]